jgi:hypothetical protein
MSVDRKKRALAFGALLLSALALGGCASSIADLPLLGTPAGAPARPTDAAAWLPVHDLPPDREEPELAPAERAKIKAELVAARDRQTPAERAKIKAERAKTKPERAAARDREASAAAKDSNSK